MRGPDELWKRLTALFRKQKLDREFDDELSGHIEMATDEYVRRGLNPVEARRMARLKFGGVDAAKELHRESRGLAWIEGLGYDLRHALRGLKRDRSFAFIAIAMLTLAVTLNVAAFTIMNTILFHGFPLVKHNDRVVYLSLTNFATNRGRVSYADVEDWRKQVTQFEGLAHVRLAEATVSFRAGDRGQNVSALQVTTNSFGLLEVQPMWGRDFTGADESPGATPVVLVSDRFWESRMGKRSDVIGSTVWLNQVPTIVVGVMPVGFRFPEDNFDIWAPLVHTPQLLEKTTGSGFLSFGRLKDGATIEQARAELETIGKRLEAQYPETNRGFVPGVLTFLQRFRGQSAPIIYGSLWAAGWFILLIACANLANLTLARTLGRSREFSTRIALGAGQWRMIRQILIEGLLLASISGVLSWWAAQWSLRLYESATASGVRAWSYPMDETTLVYLIAVACCAAILFSAAPILRVLHLDVNQMLKGDARGASQGGRAKYLSQVLVAGQMTLAIVLLAGAGLLVRSLYQLVDADVGARDMEHVLTARVGLPTDKYPTPESRVRYYDQLQSRLQAIPGAAAVSTANVRLTSWNSPDPLELADRATSGRLEDLPTAVYMRVSPDYFHVLGATVLAGREFKDGDRSNGLVAIVNERFATSYWKGKNPIGQRIRLYASGKPEEWRTVVGVASNLMQGDVLRQTFLPIVYIPLQQQPTQYINFFLRTKVAPEQLLSTVRAEALAVDPDVRLDEPTTLQQALQFRTNEVDGVHQDMGKNAALSPILAAIALLLAAIGLYAVLAHSVSQRTKEIGVRLAIGAAASDIRKLILREGMAPVAAGTFAGLALSLVVNRLLQSQLVGVSPYDPATLFGAVGVLSVIALVGCWLPTRRAIRVEPVVALRQD